MFSEPAGLGVYSSQLALVQRAAARRIKCGWPLEALLTSKLVELKNGEHSVATPVEEGGGVTLTSLSSWPEGGQLATPRPAGLPECAGSGWDFSVLANLNCEDREAAVGEPPRHAFCLILILSLSLYVRLARLSQRAHS